MSLWPHLQFGRRRQLVPSCCPHSNSGPPHDILIHHNAPQGPAWSHSAGLRGPPPGAASWISAGRRRPAGGHLPPGGRRPGAARATGGLACHSCCMACLVLPCSRSGSSWLMRPTRTATRTPPTRPHPPASGGGRRQRRGAAPWCSQQPVRLLWRAFHCGCVPEVRPLKLVAGWASLPVASHAGWASECPSPVALTRAVRPRSGRVVRLPRHYVRRKLQAAASGATPAGGKQQVNRAAVVYTCKVRMHGEATGCWPQLQATSRDAWRPGSAALARPVPSLQRRPEPPALHRATAQVCGHGTARPFYTAEAARHTVQKAGGLPSPPSTQPQQARALQPNQQPQAAPGQPPSPVVAAAAAQLPAPAATPAANTAAEAAPAQPASGPGTMPGWQPAAALPTECGPAMPPEAALQAERGGQLGGEAAQRTAAEPSAEGDATPAQPTGSPEAGMQCPAGQRLQQGAVQGDSEPPVCSEAAAGVDTPGAAAPPARAPGPTCSPAQQQQQGSAALLVPEGGSPVLPAHPDSASAARHAAAGSAAATELSAAAAAGKHVPPGGAVLGAAGSQEAGAEACLAQPLPPQQQGEEGRQEFPAQAQEEEEEEGAGTGGSPESAHPRKRRRISWRQELEDVQLIPPAAAVQQGTAPGQAAAELGGHRRRRAWFRVGRAWKSANL